LLITALFSCEKVIDVDVDDKDQQVMIEGVITDNPLLESYVDLSKTIGLNETGANPAISNAVVTVSDSEGNTFVFLETSPGHYESPGFTGVPGRTYNLSVSAEGKQYYAVSTMPELVVLQQLLAEDNELVAIGGDEDAKALTPIFQDPAGTANFYKYIVYKNNELVEGYYVSSDQFSDGNLNNTPLFMQESFGIGDSVTLYFSGIDEHVYDYFYSATLNGPGPNASATPANPVSNITGDKCLGFFSAQTHQIQSIVIQ
jgi:Domain of unknown function (DUF4249)